MEQLEQNFLDKVLRFYSDNNIDVLQIKMDTISINIEKKVPIQRAEETCAKITEVENIEAEDMVDITAPMVGVFYLRPGPDEDTYIKTGELVEAGKTLGLIEAMKCFTEFKASEGGIVKEILIADGQAFEHGQVLFRLQK